MKPIFLILISILFLNVALAGQDTVKYKIDIRRVKMHEDIDKLQDQILKRSNIAEKLFYTASNPEVNTMLRDTYSKELDVVQDTIERSSKFDHRLKVKYLMGLSHMLKGYYNGFSKKWFSPEKGIVLFSEYNELMLADRSGESIASIIDKYPYDCGNLLINTPGSVFFDNAGFKDAKVILFRKYIVLHPEEALPRLEQFADVPFADSLITASARRFPDQFYDYAAATRTRVGRLIAQNNDPLVRAITAMATSRSGRLYYPFLDEVMRGSQTVESVSAVMNDSLQYYRLLVQTQISYAERIRKSDTPLVHNELTRMLRRKAQEVFINKINALHDDPDAVRFKIVENFTPEQLYYLIVLGEEIIYTSSYKGVYNRMMERMPKQAGDSLMLRVQFDKFKKFIKMAAGYNKLDHFLSTMPDSSAQRLMIAFARGLDKTDGLEEAVDVADSYGSINTASVKNLIDREITKAYADSKRKGQRRSYVIYDILQTIFASSKDSSIDISTRLGIPPVYKVDYKNLADSSGKVIQLVFFYGDKDGIDSYGNFMSLFNGKPEWKINKTKEWVEIKSASGKPIWIFANLPLDNSKGDDPDAKAQENLLAYLDAKNLKPSIVIHRGHSYHVTYTIKQLPSSAKIVILGSCGGYHNLDDVLRISPDAHIISSKEVGTRTVNEPILKSINDDLRKGKNIDWVSMWKGLSNQFTSGEAKERFENYIPPHKNLGALFIKAYTRQMEEQEAVTADSAHTVSNNLP
ncbi:hypothetical protein [Pollutibacter soli]|uniref:hypothetical protein n=1 Tax=Pollutibacter soli TaxID=3034157 RepID=UPI003013AD87